MYQKTAKLRLSRGGSLGAVLTIAGLVGILAGASLGATNHLVSQKGREFHPSKIEINRGDTLEFINDDGDLSHHIYVRTPAFSFDSGDQEPGSRLNIPFKQTGDFTVLCAIHPKMKLFVRVN